MRMGMRRFTRLTNGFSKKVEKHVAMVNLYTLHYNFCRIHKTLRVTPAMEAGLSATAHECEYRRVDGRHAPAPRNPDPRRAHATPSGKTGQRRVRGLKKPTTLRQAGEVT